jgi:hypothetical protein
MNWQTIARSFLAQRPTAGRGETVVSDVGFAVNGFPEGRNAAKGGASPDTLAVYFGSNQYPRRFCIPQRSIPPRFARSNLRAPSGKMEGGM